MQIKGYKKDRVAVPVGLSIDKIVEHGIDPWRIDLFDNDPLIIDCSKGKFHFGKMGDVCFVYRNTNDQLIVVYKKDDDCICLEGKCPVYIDEYSVGSLEFRISDLRPSPHSYVFHLKEYLQLLNKSPEKRAFRFWSPADPAKTKLTGSDMWYSSEGKLFAGQYGGETFRERSIAAPLPEGINFLFRHLRQWRPTVFGHCLTKVLLGQTPEVIDFHIDNDFAEQATVRLASLGLVDKDTVGLSHVFAARRERPRTWPLTAFNREGLSYRFFLTGTVSSPLERSIFLSNFSANCFYSDRENEIRGPRLAVHDLAKRHARLVAPRDPEDLAVGLSIIEDRRKQLQADGFRMLD